jgi:hypothetical protein
MALTRHRDTGAHFSALWAYPINLWRDVLLPDLVKEYK